MQRNIRESILNATTSNEQTNQSSCALGLNPNSKSAPVDPQIVAAHSARRRSSQAHSAVGLFACEAQPPVFPSLSLLLPLPVSIHHHVSESAMKKRYPRREIMKMIRTERHRNRDGMAYLSSFSSPAAWVIRC